MKLKLKNSDSLPKECNPVVRKCLPSRDGHVLVPRRCTDQIIRVSHSHVRVDHVAFWQDD